MGIGADIASGRPTSGATVWIDCLTMTEKPEPILYERVGGHRKLGVLVRNFYSSLQIDPTLGPIFARHVESWPVHYATLTEFWALQTGGPGEYHGRLLHTHHLLGLKPEYFDIWLAQWRQSCRLHFEEREAAEMIALAERLAGRMREVVVTRFDKNLSNSVRERLMMKL